MEGPASEVWDHEIDVEYPLDRFVKDILHGGGKSKSKISQGHDKGHGRSQRQVVDPILAKSISIRTMNIVARVSSATRPHESS